MDRREFLRKTGAGAAVLGVSACKNAVTTAGSESSDEAVSGTMEYRTNPKTGDKVSLLGYGCMRWQMKKDENGHDIIDQDSVNELVDYAIAHGVNYFDSAPVYLQGQSEAATAKALLRHPRESYFIATKLSNFSSPSLENSIAMYKRSLEFYQTDYIDYYLLHSMGGIDAFNKRFLETGVIDFVLKEREAGHIRNLGFSFHGSETGMDELLALHEQYHWDFVQIQMNYIDWNHASGRNCNASILYKKLAERNIPVVIMEPLLGGRLSSVPEPVAEKLKEAEPTKSVASWAFRFAGTFPKVLTVLSGMTYMEHLQDNVSTYCNFKALNEEELDLLDHMATLIRDYPIIDCNYCNYCMPCPYGIDIPSIFRHYNNAVNAGEIAESSEQKDYRRLRRKYLTTYDKAVESIRQADHCITCNTCVPLCPQKVRIPRELARVDAYIEKLKQDTL